MITNGTKSYAVYTYKCGDLEWSGDATIGFNAPPDDYYNHPLSEADISTDEVACVHVDSAWNNVIIDLELNPLILPSTPEPSSFVGTLQYLHSSKRIIFNLSLRFLCSCWIH